MSAKDDEVLDRLTKVVLTTLADGKFGIDDVWTWLCFLFAEWQSRSGLELSELMPGDDDDLHVVDDPPLLAENKIPLTEIQWEVYPFKISSGNKHE